jgi:hypothetical protein
VGPDIVKKRKVERAPSRTTEGQKSLDDAATAKQKLDLYLADGMNEIVKAAEQKATNSVAVMDFVEWLDSKENNLPAELSRSISNCC